MNTEVILHIYPDITTITLLTIGLSNMPQGAVNWEDPRDRDQRLIDRLLMLYLFDRVSEESKITGDVKLQKLMFLSENEMIEDQVNGLNYKFWRWDHGPMSKGVFEDHAYLCDNELVSEAQGVSLSKGREVLKEAIPVLQENSSIIDEIDDIISNFGRMSGSRLKGVVYEKEVELQDGGERMAVKDIPRGRDIFDPVSMNNFKTTFSISPEWAETLSIQLDSEARESVREGVKSGQNTQSKPFDPSYVG